MINVGKTVMMMKLMRNQEVKIKILLMNKEMEVMMMKTVMITTPIMMPPKMILMGTTLIYGATMMH